MKRFTAAALAATTALTMTIAPAHAQVEVPPPSKPDSSSEAYKTCMDVQTENEKKAQERGIEKEYKEAREKLAKEKGISGSSNEGYCIGVLTKDGDYKAGTIALLTLVPLAIVALIGGAAAASGMIPGVSLPGVPGLPKL